MAKDFEPRCGFCGVSQSEATQLVKGLDSYICDTCVHDCLGVIEDGKKVEKKAVGKKNKSRPTPKQIKEHLDQYIIGQDAAKKILSVAVYNHYKRISSSSETELQKSNVMLVGPTGSGKTFLIESIAKFLDVPLAISDATTMTEAGYVGEDVESVLVRLVQAAEGNIKKAEHGIVYIDEIDKIAAQDSRGRDISGEGVQQGLLKMMEGSVVSINPNGRKSANAQTEMIDTKNILFVCGGAFSGITQAASKNALGLAGTTDLTSAQSSGSVSKATPKKAKKIKPKDIVKYGMIPEFVGRIPVLAQLNALSDEDLIRILTEPKNALTKQYQELFSMDGIKLTFAEDFLKEVASRASKEGTGARGLRAIMEASLTELMYESPDEETDEIVITKEFLKDPEEEKKNV